MLFGVDVGVVYMKCVLCDGDGVSVVCDEHGNRLFSRYSRSFENTDYYYSIISCFLSGVCDDE